MRHWPRRRPPARWPPAGHHPRALRGGSAVRCGRRLAKLIREGTIRVAAVAEPEQLGLHLSAVIGLRTEPIRTAAVASELAALSETEHVAITTGRYDVLVRVTIADAGALSGFL